MLLKDISYQTNCNYFKHIPISQYHLEREVTVVNKRQGNDFKKDGLQRMQEQQREGTGGPLSAETNIHRRNKCGNEAILRANGECG